MDLYDPEKPAMNSSYNFIHLSNSVHYHIRRSLHYGDLFLVIDDRIIGNIHTFCNRIFVHSKFKNGIIKIQTECDEDLGFIVLVNRVAYCFISISDHTFPIDKSILYKKDVKVHR